VDSGKLRTMSANVDSELIGLFGHWTFATAQVKRPDELKVDPRRVIEQRDNPKRQRAIVDAMDKRHRGCALPLAPVRPMHPVR